MKYILYADGGSRGNPGEAAIGAVICRSTDDHPKGDNAKLEIIKRYSEVIGRTTNNEAEYQALIFGLKKIKQVFGKEEMKRSTLEIRMDSELIVKQLNHEYKIEDSGLQKLFLRVWNLMLDFGPMKFVAIPREQNKEADRLVNQALDTRQGNLL